MRRGTYKLILAGCVLLGASSFAHADFSQALASGSVQVLSQGTSSFAQSFDSENEPGQYFDVTVDYAVFAPGTFSGLFEAFSGFSSPSDYIYAYQIHNSGSSALSRIGIDLAGGTVNAIGYDPSGVASGLIAASSGRASLDSFAFAFSNRLTPGHSSTLLLLSSPDQWALAPMSILNGGLSASAQMVAPTIIPAPSAALLIVIGVGVISAARSRRLRQGIQLNYSRRPGLAD